MRFSAILATAAIITPAVLAASGKAHDGSTNRANDHGLGIDQLDLADGLLKVKGVDLGHVLRRDEEMPGYTDGKNDGTMLPPSNADLSAPANEDSKDSSTPTSTEPNSEEDVDMLDPSSMPAPSGQEAGYPGGRAYIRSRALHAREDDDEDSYAENYCDPETDDDCDGEAYAVEDEGEPDSDNAKYLARVKRAREQHMKAKRATHNLKQASRREVVERSRHGRRAGSRPSASPRPATRI
ncbi:hypothetical protein P389DRAFT_187025 [Cystobasidium minutum MCA 4210]|uniref:uncharacterized protein n=1 Tax=Cystobasidium minutum MCA 4210 TaxID=1397322 RepID=UPI0034CF6A3D|eukprot:jgi/Rhomi1/187025/estExt_fgenesh1_pg.C_1_t10280